MNKFWKIFIICFFLFAISAILVYYFYFYKKPAAQNISKTEELAAKYPEAVTPKPDENKVRNWKIYSDPSGIFSLKYPDEITVNGAKDGSVQFLTEIKKLAELGTAGKNAESNKEQLDRGKTGILPTGGVAASNKVVSLDNGKVFSMSYLLTNSGDKCQPKLVRELVFYYGESQVKISYDILNIESSEYLTTNKNCPTKVWADESALYKLLSENKASSEIQNLYNDFDEIIKSITIK